MGRRREFLLRPSVVFAATTIGAWGKGVGLRFIPCATPVARVPHICPHLADVGSLNREPKA